MDLADKFVSLHDAVITAVERLNADDLARLCVAEQCSVAALTCHIAMVTTMNADWVRTIAAGQSLPDITMADIDRNNAEQAKLNARRGKDEILARLRTSGTEMLTVLRGLREGDPERTAPFSLVDNGQISIRILVEHGLVAHIEQHLASLQAAIGAPTSLGKE